MRVWRSPDRVWRLEYRPGQSLPWRLEWNGGRIVTCQTRAEVLDRLAQWVVDRGEEMSDLRED